MQIHYTHIDLIRFNTYVDRSNLDPLACWPWAGGVVNGYGRFWLQGRQEPAHRVAFQHVSVDPIPDGMFVCHDCPAGDNGLCVRNDEPGFYEINGILRPRWGHLWLGTSAENTADRDRKGRTSLGDRHYSKTNFSLVLRGERHGQAKLTEGQVIEIRRLAALGIRQKDVGAQFGITQTMVSHIVRRTAWTHLP